MVVFFSVGLCVLGGKKKVEGCSPREYCNSLAYFKHRTEREENMRF